MRRTNRLSLGNIFASVLMLSQLVLIFFILGFNEELTEAFPAITSIIGLLVVNEVVAVLIPALVFSFLLCRHTGERIGNFLRVKPLSSKNIKLIVLMSLCVQPLMGALNFISQLLFNGPAESTLTSLTNGMTYLQMVLVIAVIPALFEELALRGAILGAYANELDMRRTILLNGLFFGLIHLNTHQLLYAIALGALFAFIVIRTDSLFAGIIAHFTVNLTQVTLLYILSRVLETRGAYYDDINSELPLEEAVAVGGALFLGLLFFLVILSLSSVAFFKLLARFKAENPDIIAINTDYDEDETEPEKIDEASPEAAAYPEGDFSLPEIDAFTTALKSNRRFSVSFNVSLLTSIAIYMVFMAATGLGAVQLGMLLCFFTAFFFVLFLFRIRS